MQPKLRLFVSILFVLSTLSLLVAGCGAGTESGRQDSLTFAPLEHVPLEVRQAPASVQQAYRFAVANPDILTQIPCYCGCGPIGHGSNYACYVAGQAADGAIRYDSHSLGCSICVDITQDVMRLLQQGKEVGEIRAYVDATYSQYGPSNMP